jgi:uncharacterized protein (TIGR00369 family)
MMNDLMKAMLGSEHTEEAWIAGWESTEDATAAGPLGIKLVAINDEQITLKMPITDASRQPYGLLHGGISMALAETAASSHSCWKHDLSKTVPVGIEINGSHLDSAREGTVVATGTLIRKGEKIAVHEIEIHHEDSGKLLNRSRVTNLYIESPVAQTG